MAENSIFSDIDLTFRPNPHSGDLGAKVNQEAIKRAVRHALMFEPYDIPFNSGLKSSIRGYLFEQNTRLTRASLEGDIKWLLTKVEPRIGVQSIDIQSVDGDKGLRITITYKIKSINVIDNFTMVVEKVR
jgi:hypothetical protein